MYFYVPMWLKKAPQEPIFSQGRNSLKVDPLRIVRIERDFTISHFQNPKLTAI